MDRFWSHVSFPRRAGECWLWLGTKQKYGHGQFRPWAGRLVPAHKFSWELARGPVPEGLCVLHNCPGGDNAACVNPDHLWLGTRVDNNRDMWSKGRGVPGRPDNAGAAHGMAKLTDVDVTRMRALRLAGSSVAAIAAEYAMSNGQVADIVSGRAWSHVPGAAGARRKLSADEAAIVLSTPPAYGSTKALAEMFGVSAGSVSAVRSGRAWAGLITARAA